jgi:hypothetical protein
MSMSIIKLLKLRRLLWLSFRTMTSALLSTPFVRLQFMKRLQLSIKLKSLRKRFTPSLHLRRSRN